MSAAMMTRVRCASYWLCTGFSDPILSPPHVSPITSRTPNNQPDPSNPMKNASYFLTAIAVIALHITTAAAADSKLPLLLNEDFEHGASHWEPIGGDAGKAVWKVIE